VLESAAPLTPISGAPRWPKIRTQLRNRSTAIETTLATSAIQVLPSPPYQLPRASTATIAATPYMRISMYSAIWLFTAGE
jgi:hypothetical protein